jgi:outer membrane receptor protein involved in Fe transport
MIHAGTIRWHIFILVMNLFLVVSATAGEEAVSVPPDTTQADQELHEMETLVVTASRKEQVIEEVPASVTVFGHSQIEIAPTDNFLADGLRVAPGLNVAQTSAADLSISTRTATNVIAQGQLAMVDYRTIYQDFNGFVLWGTIPQEMDDIDRIEIIRGPGSAVWGANAMHGIVHLVTKSPRDMVGTRVTLTGGERSTAGVSLSHAGAGRKAAYRISGGYDLQGPFDQPTESVPGTESPLNPEGTLYPEYDNLDKRSYRVNGRVDYDVGEETVLSVAGGYAGLEGIFLSPGGPATMEAGTYQAFGKIDLTRRAMRITAFMNHDAYDGMFIIGDIATQSDDQTFNIDFSDTRILGGEHYLTYGGNARLNTYDNDLLPTAEDRTSVGAFLQDDFFVSDSARMVLGARWDYIEPMGNAISPRASLTFEPWTNQSFRATYNRAFQAPWSGRIGRHANVSVVGYWNEFRDAFQTVVSGTYTGSNPPPGWPFDPALLDGPLANAIPSSFTYANLGKSTEKGVEVGVEARLNRSWTALGTYSWQAEPELEDYTPVQLPGGTERLPVNIPPRHRASLGLLYEVPAFYVNGVVSYQDDAFWADLVDPRAWGPPDSFTMFNLGAGVRFNQGRMKLSVTAMNLFDSTVQQHVWGDFIRRRVVGKVSYSF